MSFELIEVEAKLKDVKPKKKGKKDDAPLVVILPFQLDIPAGDVLPLFHANLRHFLFDESGIRFHCYLDTISWSQEHANMELEIAGLTLQAEKIGRYKIAPFDNGHEDRDIGNRIFLGLQATILLGQDSNPISLLSELINTTMVISIRPSQLNLLDNQAKDQAIVDIATGRHPQSTH